jgi:hypothetical protein
MVCNNLGYFHYPFNDLSLEEYVPQQGGEGDPEEEEDVGSSFSLAYASNIDCNTHCSARGQQCDGGALAAVEGADMFAKMVAPYHVCAENPNLSCSLVAPAVEDDTGRCYFRGTANTTECLLMQQSQDDLPQEDVCADRLGQLCAASSPHIQRLCACTSQHRGNGGDRRQRREQSGIGDSELDQEAAAAAAATSSAAASPNHSRTAFVIAAAVATLVGGGNCYGSGIGSGSGGTRRRHSFWTTTAALSVATMVLSAFPVTNAHNWMMTPGRAMFEASTTKPCRGRKATDTHAQVGPGQTFIMEWATGHPGRTNNLIIVHNSDEDKLLLPNIQSIMNDYLANAPANSSSHMEVQRYHGVTNARNMYESSRAFLTTKGHIYKAELSKDDPNWLEHTHASKPLAVFSYQDDVLAKDKRVSYHSEKYPWIEAVYTYMIMESRATDWDGVRVSIPAKKGPGHYIVNWGFQGYYDCVDVEVFDDRQIEHIDGKLTGGHTWSKIDHCQYVGVSESRGITTPCMPATGNSLQECIDAVSNGFGELERLGINVVPIQNPSGVAFPDQVNIPWKSDKCANTAWTLVAKNSGGGGGGGGDKNSRITENPLPELKERLGNPLSGIACDDGSAQLRRGRFYNLATHGRSGSKLVSKQMTFFPSTVKNSAHDNVKPSRLTLRQAMQSCGVDPFCSHIEVRNLVQQNEDVFDDIVTGEHEFYGCQAVKQATDRTDRKVWSRPGKYDPSVSYSDTWFNTNAANLTSWQISFHPDGSEEGDGGQFPGQMLPEGWFADTGKQFSTHKNGLKYGWKCDVAQPTIRRSNDISFVGMNRGSFTSEPTKLIVNVPFDAEHTILNAAWVENPGQLTCPHESDNTTTIKNVWEMEVPNGIYRVGVMMAKPRFVHQEIGPDGPKARYAENSDISAAGCGIHHTAADQRFHKNHGQSGYIKWKNVEVNNNRLQLSGTNLAGISGSGVVACSQMNTVQIYKISDNLFPSQWLPSSGAGGAWYQHEVPRGTKIGLVDIKFPRNPSSPSTYGQSFADCRYAWMLYGDRCQYTGSRTDADHAANAPIGDFNAADQGFAVSVADSPCIADSGCVGGTVCMVVRAPWIRVWGRTAPLPQDFAIDCNGARGKFVRIHLPGANRIFSGAAYVNTVEPPAFNPNQLACYGVRPRAQTSTVPEFLISHDPADPIFYSSCLVRERNMEWVAPNTPPPPPPPPRSDFGMKCLDCNNYKENRALVNTVNYTMIAPPVWIFSEHCLACSEEDADGADDAVADTSLKFENEKTQCPTTTSTTTTTINTPTTTTITTASTEIIGYTTSDTTKRGQDAAAATTESTESVGVERQVKPHSNVGVVFAVMGCLTAAVVTGIVYREKLQGFFSSRFASLNDHDKSGAHAPFVNPVYDAEGTDVAAAAVALDANSVAPMMPDAGPQAIVQAEVVQHMSKGISARISAKLDDGTTEQDDVYLLGSYQI